MTEIIYPEESYKIVGAAMAVHSELGSGFLESVYQEALERELRDRDIPHRSQASIRISYKGEALNASFVADFVCYDKIIVEIKALTALSGVERAQTLNYLKATGMKLGLLINFGQHGQLKPERLVL